ncbi:hypothetical protein KI387_042267, partial [Taxus chinensis]
MEGLACMAREPIKCRHVSSPSVSALMQGNRVSGSGFIVGETTRENMSGGFQNPTPKGYVVGSPNPTHKEIGFIVGFTRRKRMVKKHVGSPPKPDTKRHVARGRKPERQANRISRSGKQ